MKKHTIGYKEQIKEMGRESDSIITFGEAVLGSEKLNAVTPSFQSSLLKSAMKQLDIDSNVEIPVGTILNYKFGTKVNAEYEYIDYGNYVVKEVEKQEDTLSYKITCYDKMLYSMKDYVDFGVEYPISVREYINSLCEYLGLKFANVNDTFVNYDKIIPNELYLDENGNSLGYTFRDVFDELAQVTASTICINDNDEVEIRYIKDAINSSIKKGIKIETNDNMDYPVLNYKQYGYTKQDGTPTPDTPIEIEVGRGKNLFDKDNYKLNKDATWTPTAKGGYFSNTVAWNGVIFQFELEPNTQYTFNAKITSNETLYLYINSYTDNTYETIKTRYARDVGVSNFTFTPDSPYVAITFNTSSIVTNVLIDEIQLEKGSVATSYLPYNTIENKSTGKNLLNPVGESRTISGLIFTNNGDGSFTVKGTSTEARSLTLSNLEKYPIYFKKGEYYTQRLIILSGTMGGSIVPAVQKSDGTITYNYISSSKDYPTQIKQAEDDYTVYSYTHYIPKGTTLDVTYKVQLERGKVATEWGEYQESSVQYNLGDNFLADKDYIENGVLNKNIRHLRLAIADMNNGEDYPGWRNISELYSDFPGQNTNFGNVTKAWINIDGANTKKLGINTLGDAPVGTIWLQPAFFGLTQTQWKEQYPDLVVDIYYEMPQTEQIPLETTGELRTFEPSTIITNDLDSDMEVEYGNSFDTIDEEYFKDINVNFGEKYGPINSVVLSRASESDNIYLRDEESVEKNGLCELKIKENQIMNFNNRDEFLQGIFEKLNGTEYHLNDFASTGITYYDICDRYKVNIGDKIYSCVMFNDEILVTQGLEENVFTEMSEESETDYTKSDKTDKKINQTYIIANKQKGEIESLTSQIRTINNELDNVYTIEQTNRLIQNAETGVTNTFSEAGGNNEFRNTGIWFKNTSEDSETNPYEFWKGKANEGSNDKATNYRSILLGKGSFIQDDVKVPNGNYSISFYYRKLIASAIASVVINDKEYPLDSLEVKQFYTGEQNSETGEYIVDPIVVTNNHIKIEFKCDALDGVEVYDLMCNKGSVKLAYSQNQNETTTSTVNISKGITITSSADENTKFKADYDGIRVLDKNNSVKTKFTDKGTETDELVVRKKATITGLLHQEVDDQTWVTKI